MSLLWFALASLLIASAAQQNPPYSYGEALRYTLYSFANYCSESSIQNWSCYFCKPASTPVTVEFVFYDPSTDTFGYAGRTDTEVIFSFRGTEINSIDNWITDLTFAKTTVWNNVPGALVHEGFYDAYLAIFDQVHAAADYYALNYPALPFVFTGHSLGAALAELCAVDIATNGSYVGPYTVWNVGAPRVGNDVFAQLYTQYVNTTWRTVNSDDIVPHLPFQSMGFQHVPYEVWYPQDMTATSSYTICDASGEDPNCSDSLAPDYEIPPHLTYFGYYCLTPCGGPGEKPVAKVLVKTA
eukprot:TRINITY_DN14731_c1_g1_i1.p1 TRINITY_DN14731_c1_g1~~TRINITY_DN14731_c1_g1_i1.p1  ORF type:complete len:318 (-),score=91.12 TRINITY_DN14731_c1_g1_i1:369-1262(-)